MQQPVSFQHSFHHVTHTILIRTELAYPKEKWTCMNEHPQYNTVCACYIRSLGHI